MLTLCALEHFIIACIAVRSKMTNVSDVHYSLYVITVIAEILFQNVLHYIASQIADMGIVINCRTAGIH